MFEVIMVQEVYGFKTRTLSGNWTFEKGVSKVHFVCLYVLNQPFWTGILMRNYYMGTVKPVVPGSFSTSHSTIGRALNLVRIMTMGKYLIFWVE